jgi:hypothetical protein
MQGIETLSDWKGIVVEVGRSLFRLRRSGTERGVVARGPHHNSLGAVTLLLLHHNRFCKFAFKMRVPLIRLQCGGYSCDHSTSLN